MRAVLVTRHGGPETLELDEVAEPHPDDDEAVVDVPACGVNFIDVYYRHGAFSIVPPFIPGSEATGEVVAVGSEVSQDLLGRRVAFITYPTLQGTYAERVRVKAWRLVPIGPDIGDVAGASTLMVGMTAHYLARDLRSFAPGEWALAHAAAGEVGSALIQLLSRMGVRTIGAVYSAQKAELAQENGAEATVLTTGDWVEEVKDLTKNDGVDAVFDSVGKDTFDGSLDCIRRRGWMVQFGISSGPPPRPISSEELLHRGSLTLTRPGLSDFTATSDQLRRRAQEIFALVQRGELRIRIADVLSLEQA